MGYIETVIIIIFFVCESTISYLKIYSFSAYVVLIFENITFIKKIAIPAEI